VPDGLGKVNKEGVNFYHKVIDECLQLGLTPFVTLYHWDLPQELKKRGGWANHLIAKWFARFVSVCAEAFGDKVKTGSSLMNLSALPVWVVCLVNMRQLKKGLDNFLPALHHAALAQADGGRLIRKLVPIANIRTTFSFSQVMAYTDKKEDVEAANRIDILMNRMLLEPAVRKGILLKTPLNYWIDST